LSFLHNSELGFFRDTTVSSSSLVSLLSSRMESGPIGNQHKACSRLMIVFNNSLGQVRNGETIHVNKFPWPSNHTSNMHSRNDQVPRAPGHPVPGGYKYRNLALKVGGVSDETVKYDFGF
jgi:hypothetical protein